MADIPGLNADVFFGSVDAPPVEWREKLEYDDSPDDIPPTDEERAALNSLLGFDASELDEETKEDASQ